MVQAPPSEPEDPSTALPAPASWELDSRHSGALLRLYKLLTSSSGFRLILLEFNDPVYRDKVIQHINRFPVHAGILVLDDKIKDFNDFENRLTALCRTHDTVHVVNLETWLKLGKPGENRLQGFNYHRENIAEQCPANLLLWMIRPDIRVFALQAPDMWAWRTDVPDFSLEPEAPGPGVERRLDLRRALRPERLQRIAEIEQYLSQERPADRRRALLLSELGQIREEAGDWPEALKHFEEALQIYRDLDDKRNAAFMLSHIADIRFHQGELDDALKWKIGKQRRSA